MVYVSTKYIKLWEKGGNIHGEKETYCYTWSCLNLLEPVTTSIKLFIRDLLITTSNDDAFIKFL